MPPVTWRASWITWFLSNDSLPSNTASENTSSSLNTLDPSCAAGSFSNQAVSVSSSAAPVRPSPVADHPLAPSTFLASTCTW